MTPKVNVKKEKKVRTINVQINQIIEKHKRRINTSAPIKEYGLGNY